MREKTRHQKSHGSVPLKLPHYYVILRYLIVVLYGRYSWRTCVVKMMYLPWKDKPVLGQSCTPENRADSNPWPTQTFFHTKSAIKNEQIRGRMHQSAIIKTEPYQLPNNRPNPIQTPSQINHTDKGTVSWDFYPCFFQNSIVWSY